MKRELDFGQLQNVSGGDATLAAGCIAGGALGGKIGAAFGPAGGLGGALVGCMGGAFLAKIAEAA